MADAISIQELIDARTDAKTLEEAVNGDAVTTVLSRLGETYPTLSNALNQIDSKLDSADAQVKQGITNLFENGGLPATPFATKALMTASVLVDGKYAMVTDDSVAANNGLYLKTAGAWVKSSYDPLAQANNHTENRVKEAVSSIDVSTLLNRYDLTFAEAVAAVPSYLRKQGLVVRYNNVNERKFINNNVTTNWLSERFWLRPTNTVAEGKLNHVDERMYYKGFRIGTGSGVTYDPLDTALIIPITRTYTDGVENKATVISSPVSISLSEMGYLDKNGVSLMRFGGAGSTQFSYPANSEYIFFNLGRKNTGELIDGNVAIAKKNMRYILDSSEPALTVPATNDGMVSIEYAPPYTSIEKDYKREGTRYVSPFFVSAPARDGVHIAQIVKHVEVQKGQFDLINKLTGLPRRFVITRLAKSTTNNIDVFISCETEDGVMNAELGTYALPSDDGYVRIVWKESRDLDTIKVRLVIDPSQLKVGTTQVGELYGEIHPSIILAADKLSGKNKGVQFTQFTDVGVARQGVYLPNDFDTTQSVEMSRDLFDGILSHTANGDPLVDHQQTTLVADKTARFAGKAGIYVDVDANYPDNPVVDMLREEGGAPYRLDGISGLAMIGKTMPSQWIHPDICYAPDGVGGYKYWMINSNFPNSYESREDGNLFVSNNGSDWTRVRGFLESDDGGVGFNLPQIFWKSNYNNGFMSIPTTANTLEFAFKTTTETKKITSYLAHDPAISYHNGYINVYVLYNFGTVSTVLQNKYVVCYRTNDGVNWEIVQEDGGAIPYNEQNALLVFSRTNGKRNHIKYDYLSYSISAKELSPQVVKVSENEWYYYVREGSSNMSLIRYAGSSPYVFNWDSPQAVSKNNTVGGGLWHYCIRFYEGLYYCLTNGYMFTSTDGISFTTTPYPFFWKGGGGKLYKPSFVVGHDGKVKLAYGVETRLAAPHPFKPQLPVTPSTETSRIRALIKISYTLITEYNSLADIMYRSAQAIPDAYVDVIVMMISQMTNTIQIRVMPCLRSLSELLDTIDVDYDAEFYVMAHLNTRNGGLVKFGGVAVTLPNASE